MTIEHRSANVKSSAAVCCRLVAMFRRIKTQYVEFTEVVDIKVLDGYKVWVRFHDGTSGEADLSDMLEKPYFAKIWADREGFENVWLENGVPVWGEDDHFSPDSLYHRVTGFCPDGTCGPLKEKEPQKIAT